jgi:hypothetical protein
MTEVFGLCDDYITRWAEPHRVRAEVVRYFGWPGQAISYKLGERGWPPASRPCGAPESST